MDGYPKLRPQPIEKKKMHLKNKKKQLKSIHSIVFFGMIISMNHKHSQVNWLDPIRK